MGQYHLTVNLDKREFLDPHKLGDGLKLREQLASEAGVAASLLLLLAASNGRGGGDLKGKYNYDPSSNKTGVIGRWAGDRIVVIGDYGEEGDIPAEFGGQSLYGRCRLGEEMNGMRQGDTEESRDAAEVVATLGDLFSDHGFEDGVPTGPDGEPLPIDFVDISDLVIPAISESLGVEISGDGWRNKKQRGG